MTVFDLISTAFKDSDIAEGLELPKVQLNKWLMFGQSAYVCRYGTLSDGHEKITDAQRYAQAIKEQYMYSVAVRAEKVKALRFQAALLDAKEKKDKAVTEAETLRAQADFEEAETGLLDTLLQIEDRVRCIKEFAKVRAELAPIVEAKYVDLEAAEPDNWKAVAEYRMIKQQVPGMTPERLDNVPMDPITKAKFGLHAGRFDAMAPLMVAHKDKLTKLDNREDAMQEFVAQLEQLNEVKQ